MSVRNQSLIPALLENIESSVAILRMDLQQFLYTGQEYSGRTVVEIRLNRLYQNI